MSGNVGYGVNQEGQCGQNKVVGCISCTPVILHVSVVGAATGYAHLPPCMASKEDAHLNWRLCTRV